MSHYTTIQTEICDRECLLQALAALGFTEEKVEAHENPVHLYGWKGRKREQVAEIVIRRQHVGHTSNDIGFTKTEAGLWKAIISDYDRGYDGNGRYGQGWMNRLRQEYAKAKVLKEITAQGFTLSQQTVRNGQIHMTVSRMGY